MHGTQGESVAPRDPSRARKPPLRQMTPPMMDGLGALRARIFRTAPRREHVGPSLRRPISAVVQWQEEREDGEERKEASKGLRLVACGNALHLRPLICWRCSPVLRSKCKSHVRISAAGFVASLKIDTVDRMSKHVILQHGSPEHFRFMCCLFGLAMCGGMRSRASSMPEVWSQSPLAHLLEVHSSISPAIVMSGLSAGCTLYMASIHRADGCGDRDVDVGNPS